MTFGDHFGSHIDNMKNAYKQLFYAKIDKHPSTLSIRQQDLFLYIVSSEINQSVAVEGLNASKCHPHGHVFDIFNFRKI